MSFLQFITKLDRITKAMVVLGKIVRGHHQAMYEAGQCSEPPEPLPEDYEELVKLFVEE